MWAKVQDTWLASPYLPGGMCVPVDGGYSIGSTTWSVDQGAALPEQARTTATSPKAGAASSERVTKRVIDELERMIISGDLLPGQQIRQETMAEQLGVSRLPIREGLRQLTAAGLVQHVHNVGYTVARLDQSELEQIYLMRAVLERETLRALPALDAAVIDEISALNDAVKAAAERLDLLDMRLRNQAFHFAIFEQSRLHLVVSELKRLWTLSMPYQAVYLYDAQGRARVIHEHERILSALREHDIDRLVEITDLHRQGGQATTNLVLQPRVGGGE